MNIQKLNEILDIRRKEMKNLNLSYNFNKYISTCFNRYVNYLKENGIEHNEDSKNKFLIDMESVIRKKDFNYYRHAIGIIEDINYVHTCKNTNRIIRYEKDYLLNDYNKNIIDKYYDSRIEYNKKRTIEEKKVILRDLLLFCQNNNINDYSKLDIESVNKIKEYCLNFDLYSQKKNYLWTLRDFFNFLYDIKNISLFLYIFLVISHN